MSNIVASWADTKHVHVWDISAQIAALDNPDSGRKPAPTKPLKSHKHRDEGFAMGWSPIDMGHLLTGDCSGQIIHWSEHSGTIHVDTVCVPRHRTLVGLSVGSWVVVR